MIERVVNAACAELRCSDFNNVCCAIKLDNAAYMGIRKLYTDQVANSVSKNLVAGSILTILESGEQFVVSTVTKDYFKGKFLRNVLDLVEMNNTVTVTRIVHTPSPQGGVGTTTETVIHENIPIKVWNISLKADKLNDSTYEQMGMLLSIFYPVQHGDQLTFGSYYSKAKVEGIKHNFEGFNEVVFDKDPRWT